MDKEFNRYDVPLDDDDVKEGRNELLTIEPSATEKQEPEQPETNRKDSEKDGDIEHRFPPTKDPGLALREGNISVYGMSVRGTSHISSGTPCQDYNDFTYLPEEEVWVLAIADGVGSCALSHWGAYTAVSKGLECIRAELHARSGGKKLTLRQFPEEEATKLFDYAFDQARTAVEDFADRNERSPVEFQSTLTAAIYDGDTLYICHVGDDGIVAEGVSGKYQMITQRIKGEEANSVFTLQADRMWQVQRVTNVAAFVMSTDGVLDSYVGNAARNNRVYYPFFADLVYSKRPASGTAPEKAKEYLSQWAEDCGVHDDLTVVSVVNLSQLDRPTRPEVEKERAAFIQEQKKWKEEQKKQLYSGTTTLKKPTPTGGWAKAQKMPNRQPAQPEKPVSEPPRHSEPYRTPAGSQRSRTGNPYRGKFQQPRSWQYPPEGNSRQGGYEWESNQPMVDREPTIYVYEDVFEKLTRGAKTLFTSPVKLQCPQCGKVYDPAKVKFCPNCGVRLEYNEYYDL